MRTLLFVLLLLPNTSLGQSFFLGLSAEHNNTSLRNKADRSSDLLTHKASFAPAAGLRFGYIFNHSVFHAISIGADYWSVVQHADGKSQVSEVQIFEAKAEFKYLRIPLTIEFSLPEVGKLTPLLAAGVYYSHLLHYRDERKNVDPNFPYYWMAEDLRYEQNDFFIHDFKGELDQPYYKNDVFGALLKLGVEYKLGNHLALLATATGTYSFGDIENKTFIRHTGGFSHYNPWQYMDPKYYNENLRNNFKYDSGRPKTKIMTLGLQLEIRYYLRQNQ